MPAFGERSVDVGAVRAVALCTKGSQFVGPTCGHAGGKSPHRERLGRTTFEIHLSNGFVGTEPQQIFGGYASTKGGCQQLGVICCRMKGNP